MNNKATKTPMPPPMNEITKDIFKTCLVYMKESVDLTKWKLTKVPFMLVEKV
jgi:hypothetical protein